MGGESLLRNLGSFDRDVTDKAERRILRDSEQNATTHPVTAFFSIHAFLLPSSSFTYGASASRLPSRHGGREPVSMPRRRRSGVRTLTKRGPAAFLAPSSQIPLASTCLVPASSFCGRSFQASKTSIRSSSRAAEPPGARVTLYGSELGAYGVLFFHKKRLDPDSFRKSPPERSGIDYRLSILEHRSEPTRTRRNQLLSRGWTLYYLGGQRQGIRWKFLAVQR